MIAIGQGYFDAASELPDDVGELGILLTRMIRNTTAGAQAAHAKACAPFEAIGGMNTRAEFESATGT